MATGEERAAGYLQTIRMRKTRKKEANLKKIRLGSFFKKRGDRCFCFFFLTISGSA